MGFPTSVADEVLVRCRRHCCLCGVYAGQKIEVHHIVQVAEGGDNSADNCIPLCLNCHAEVKSYNPGHPKGRKFTEKELKGHRDKCYAQFEMLGHLAEMDKIIEEPLKVQFTSPKINTLPTWGYVEQDKKCMICPGSLILIAGYAGTKKSTYVQHVVNWNLKRGHRIVYCCLKDHPMNVAMELIAEASHISVNDLKQGNMTEDSWNKIAESQKNCQGENLALFPYDQVVNYNNIISLVENSEADIVVVDDFNGIEFDNINSIEKFIYQLKHAAGRNNTVVFCVYNLSMSKRRMDMHPMLSDFPTDAFYRLFDVVQLLFRPEMHYGYDDELGVLEVINLKGAWKNPCTFKMASIDDIKGVFSTKE